MTSTAQHPDRPGQDADAAQSIELLALQAQGELLPYALGVFAVALPVFVWAGSYATNAVWMSSIFVQFSLNWAVFYGLINRLQRRPELRLDLAQRSRLHVGGGLLWALAVAEIAIFGFYAGPIREIVLDMATASAVACFFFASPSLKSLMIVGPAAAAGPILALVASRDPQAAIAASGGLSLAMVLCLIVNRILRRQFALAVEREALIAERASSLEQAERLAKSKSLIVATLSHEIRNGLTGVSHALAAAAGAGRGAPTREQLAAAVSAADDLLDVLDATLDTETAEAGKLVLSAKPFDAARLTRSAVMMSRPKAAAKGLELNIHVEDGLGGAHGAALGDPVRVRQILSNLIGNAVKFTSRGRVEVRVHRCGEGRIRFEVADTGPGLSPDELQLAFQPFMRIDRTGLGLPGAGLGLSLSRELARLMGGELCAESAVGVGSRFWFELRYDADATLELGDGEAPQAGQSPGVARSLRILIAEDDALTSAMLRSILEQLGHQVVHAGDGRRALELAEFCQFDLIMLDGGLPQMSGAEAAAEIRTLAVAARGAPIVALIGDAPAEAESCVAAGVNGILRRPVTVAGVARAIAAATDRKETAGRGVAASPAAPGLRVAN